MYSSMAWLRLFLAWVMNSTQKDHVWHKSKPRVTDVITFVTRGFFFAVEQETFTNLHAGNQAVSVIFQPFSPNLVIRQDPFHFRPEPGRMIHLLPMA